jgi:hypothetical protein
VTELEYEEIISGRIEFLVRFFKRGQETVKEIGSGDIVYFRRKKGEVLGQFEIGKLILAEKFGGEDIKIFTQFFKGLKQDNFKEMMDQKKTMIIIQIENLEQFITSPIDQPRSKKEWVVIK